MLLDHSVVNLFPWKNSAYATFTVGFPDAHIYQICVGAKLLQLTLALAVQFVVLAEEYSYLNELSLALVLLYLLSSALVFLLTLVTVLLRLTHAPSEAPAGSGDVKRVDLRTIRVDAPMTELAHNPMGASQHASTDAIGHAEVATLKMQMNEMRRAAEQQRRETESNNQQMVEMRRAVEQQRRETESNNQQMDEMRRQLQDFASRLEKI